jgi:hypothetical protein
MRLLGTIAMAAWLLVAGSDASALTSRAAWSAGTCPGYREELLRARAALEQGDRVAATAALRRARRALDSCLEEGVRAAG